MSNVTFEETPVAKKEETIYILGNGMGVQILDGKVQGFGKVVEGPIPFIRTPVGFRLNDDQAIYPRDKGYAQLPFIKGNEKGRDLIQRFGASSGDICYYLRDGSGKIEGDKGHAPEEKLEAMPIRDMIKRRLHGRKTTEKFQAFPVTLSPHLKIAVVVTDSKLKIENPVDDSTPPVYSNLGSIDGKGSIKNMITPEKVSRATREGQKPRTGLKSAGTRMALASLMKGKDTIMIVSSSASLPEIMFKKEPSFKKASKASDVAGPGVYFGFMSLQDLLKLKEQGVLVLGASTPDQYLMKNLNGKKDEVKNARSEQRQVTSFAKMRPPIVEGFIDKPTDHLIAVAKKRAAKGKQPDQSDKAKPLETETTVVKGKSEKVEEDVPY